MCKTNIYLVILLSLLLAISCENQNVTNPSESDDYLLAPSDFTLEQIAVNQCKLVWKDNSQGEEGFIISRKKDDEDWVEEYTTLEENSEEFIDDILPYSTYRYKITVFVNDYYSPQIENSLTGVFPGPVGLQVTQLSASSYKLTWEDISNGEEGYRISCKCDNGEWVEEYALLEENSEEYIADNILIDASYFFRVSAYFQNTTSNYNEIGINSIFPAPSSLLINQLSGISCKLTWNDNNDWEAGYKISRKSGDEDWVENFAVIDANSEEYIDESMLPTGDYYYRVRAYSEQIESDYIEKDIRFRLISPSNLELTKEPGTSLKLTWQDNYQWEDGYKISRKRDDEDWVEDYAILTAESEEFVDNSFDWYLPHTYRVSAFVQGFQGDYIESEMINLAENMVLVPGGTYIMGDINGTSLEDSQPTHEVTINSFLIGKYEVTQEEYLSVMGNNPSYFSGLDHPVEMVTWFNAVEYCNARSIQEGLTPCYNTSDWTCDFSADGYRLPTEAEWEYAARGASNEPDYIYSGSDNPLFVAWYEANSFYPNIGTKPVGLRNPNSLGTHDMSGNVYEWCYDWYESYSQDSQTNPSGPSSGTFRVNRGGAWRFRDDSCEVVGRGSYPPTYSYNYLGFRYARSIE